MGLLLGASVVSLIELLDWCIFACLVQRQRHQERQSSRTSRNHQQKYLHKAHEPDLYNNAAFKTDHPDIYYSPKQHTGAAQTDSRIANRKTKTQNGTHAMSMNKPGVSSNGDDVFHMPLRYTGLDGVGGAGGSSHRGNLYRTHSDNMEY